MCFIGKPIDKLAKKTINPKLINPNLFEKAAALFINKLPVLDLKKTIAGIAII